jgi:hypothetical protein
MENYSKNQKFNLERIDPKGIASVGVYGSFSGVIERAQLFNNVQDTLQLSYKVYMSEEWHDETPETDVRSGLFRTPRENRTSASQRTEKLRSV